MKFIGKCYSLYTKDIQQIGVAPQSCYDYQNSVENHVLTLKFNTRPTFYT